ncbi:MAG: polysaccharide pyruvyl transferase family protein, partial [Pseudomonadota bacterium]
FTGDAQEELQNGALSIAPHSRTPADLAAVIQACDAVVAHRLHALIVAYAYRIPHIGLSTNAKLDQFFDMTLRRRYCLSTDEASPDVIAQRVDDALREPIDSATHEALLARARGEIDSLADAIRARASKLKGSPASAPSPAR